MVSMGQLVGMVLAIVIPVLIVVLLFLHIKKELKVKGLVFTACYGLLGYIWVAWIYVMAYGWVGAFMMQYPWFQTVPGQIMEQIIIAAVYAVLTSAGLWWAIYLANMREPRMERGAAIGCGFGMSYIVWNYVLVYGAPLIYGFQMRFGGFNGSDEAREKVLGLTVENMYLFILDTVVFAIIVTATMVVVSFFYANGRRGRVFLIPFVTQFLIKFLDTLFPTLMPDIVSAVLYHVLTGLAAIWSLWIIMNYLKTGQVMLKPGVPLQIKEKKKPAAKA